MQQITKIIVKIYSGLFKLNKTIILSISTTVILLIIICYTVITYFENKDNKKNNINIINESNINAITVYNSKQILNYDKTIFDKLFSISNKYTTSNYNNLTSILTQYNSDISNIMSIYNQNRASHNLQMGQILSWEVNKNEVLQTLTWINSQQETQIYISKNNSSILSEEKEVHQGVWADRIFQGKINGNFTSSAIKAGLIYNEAYEASKALQWQIDLRKLKSGDKFSVLLSREILGGHTEPSRLLGVHLLTNGKNYYVFRAENGRYYDSEANSLERSFLRYPTARTFNVSSHFSLRRINPVTGLPAPHQGVDFSMPIGTPILSVGDGEVIVAKYNNIAGYFITIRHSNQYTTRYMHLRKLLVKPGQKVKRGERIALSGNTGRTTGPHLHYELWFKRQTINPLTANLPYSSCLTGKDRQLFLNTVKENKLKLATN